ncbi:hypothetical protein BH24CHL10_BH24CHL10_08020 [soil metagenome]
MVVQLRDRDVIDLARLRAWADEWDDEGDGACWPASRCVQWIEVNLADHADRDDDTRQAGQRRRRG